MMGLEILIVSGMVTNYGAYQQEHSAAMQAKEAAAWLGFLQTQSIIHERQKWHILSKRAKE